MFYCEIVTVARNAQCRSGSPNCPCKGYAGIKKGEDCLRISMYSSGGTATAFYCNKCMFYVLDKFRKVINFIDTGTVI